MFSPTGGAIVGSPGAAQVTIVETDLRTAGTLAAAPASLAPSASETVSLAGPAATLAGPAATLAGESEGNSTHASRAGTDSALPSLGIERRPDGRVLLQWAAAAGKTYRLQYKSGLRDESWEDLPGDVTATGATAFKWDDPFGDGAERLYRVVLVR